MVPYTKHYKLSADAVYYVSFAVHDFLRNGKLVGTLVPYTFS